VLSLRSFILKSIVSTLITTNLIACGGGSGGGTPAPPSKDPKPPKVVTTSPASEAIDVKINTDIVVIFDKDIDKVSRSNIAISPVNTSKQISFTATTKSNTITILPDINEIAESTIYKVTISDVKNADGVAMQKSCVWKFETNGPVASILDRVGNTGPCGTKSLVWTGTKQFGAKSVNTFGTSIAVDSINNVFVTGYTYGGLDGNTRIGTNDVFVAKYDVTGNKQWVKQLGVASAGTGGTSITTDSKNNVYVLGDTIGGLDGNAKIGTRDFFIIKYDLAGIKQWSKQIGNAASETFGRDISVDSNGNIYVVADTRGGLDGNVPIGNRDVFVIKYDATGAKQWTKQLGVAATSTSATAISLDSNNNIFVTGKTTGSLDGNTLMGKNDIFVIKYNASGIKQWSKQLGAISAGTMGIGISTDSTNNIFVTGTTTGGLDGNTITGTKDIFVTKYNVSGVKQWTKQLGVASASIDAAGISIDSKNNIFVTGSTAGGLEGNVITGNPDVFVIKFNASGDKQWNKQLGAISAKTYGRGIAINSKDNIFVTGETTGGLTGNTLFGRQDVFIIKYDTLGKNQ
jgi:hypothetical protein